MQRINHHFTFGQGHMSSFPLPAGGGRLADYWVTVSLPPELDGRHREFFIDKFSSHYCPRPNQFAMQYDDKTMKAEYFPGGQLCLVTEHGVKA